MAMGRPVALLLLNFAVLSSASSSPKVPCPSSLTRALPSFFVAASASAPWATGPQQQQRQRRQQHQQQPLTFRQQIGLNFVKTERPQPYPWGQPGWGNNGTANNGTTSNSTNASSTNASMSPTPSPVPDGSFLMPTSPVVAAPVAAPASKEPSRFPTQRPTRGRPNPTIAPAQTTSIEPTPFPPSQGPTGVPEATSLSSVEPTLATAPTAEPTRRPPSPPTHTPTGSSSGAPTPPSQSPGTSTPTPTPTGYEAMEGPRSSLEPTLRPSLEEIDDDDAKLPPAPAPATSPAPPATHPSSSTTSTVSPTAGEHRSTAEQDVGLVLVERVVPFRFNATLIKSNNTTTASDNQLLSEWTDTWEQYILARLQASFRNDNAAYVQQVQLVLQQVGGGGIGDDNSNTNGGQQQQQERSQPQRPTTPGGQQQQQQKQQQPPPGRLRRGRILQSSSSSATTTVQADGNVVFQADQDRPVSTLAEQTQSNLDPVLTKESLQQALVLAEDPATTTDAPWSVQSVEAEYPASTSSSSSNASRFPTTVEIVFGFFLLFLALFALAYTLYLLCQRWKKQRKLNRQQQQHGGAGSGSLDPALRKGSIVAKVPPPSSAARSAAVSGPTTLLSPTIVPSSRTRSPQRISSLPTSTLPESTDDDDDEMEVYPGLGRSTETESTNQRPTSGDDDEESEFGFQLRQAAYVDQAAWDEYQRRKQLLAQEAMLFRPAANLGAANAAMLLPVAMRLPRGVYDDDYNDDAGDDSKAGNDHGLEVDALGIPVVASLDRVRSFPYGDEKDDVLFLEDDGLEHEETAVISPAAARAAAAAAMARSFDDDDVDDNNNIHLRQVPERQSGLSRPLQSLRAFTTRLRGVDASLQEAVEWTPTGMALRSPPKSPLEGDDPNFEPYGDEHKMTLQESWEQDDPVPPIKAAAFSFLYPLQRQHVSDSTKSTTDTQQSSSGGQPAIMRASPTGSAWSTGAAVDDGPRDFPTLDRRELLGKPLPSHDEEDDRKNNGDEDNDDDDDQAGTERMLREVAMINAYVKRYEQQKRMSERVQAADVQYRRDQERGLGPGGVLNTSIGVATQGSTDDTAGSKSYSASYEAMDDSASGQKRSAPQPLSSVKEDLARARQVQGATGSRGRNYIEGYVGDPGFDPNLESPSGSNDGEEDDASQRLGIQRYAIQRPPILSYRQHSSREDPRSGVRAMPPLPPPPPPLPPPGARSNFSLSRLRRNRAVLDTATGKRGEAGFDVDNSSRPFDERRDLAAATGSSAPADTSSTAASAAASNPSSGFRLSPRAKRNNADFNELLTMFESRPSQSIVPPTIHWQYEK